MMSMESFILINLLCCCIIGFLLRRQVWWKFIPIVALAAYLFPKAVFFIGYAGIATDEYNTLEAIFVRSAAILGCSSAFILRLTYRLFRRYKDFRETMKTKH